MVRSLAAHKRSRVALFAAVCLTPAVIPASASAASPVGIIFNNLSLSSTLNTDPSSSDQADDVVVRSGDRLYLGASADPQKLSGWLTLDDGSKQAFGPGDYVLTSSGDNEYTLSFPGAGALKVAVVKSANVPSMFIKTSGGLANIEANQDNVDTNGSMALVNPDGSATYNGTLAEMKGRGNTTWGYPKKPYQIKLAKSTELAPGAGAAKTWILLANYLDASGIRNEVAYNMESAVLQRAGSPDFAIKGRMIDLFIDGNFRGSYYLCEKVQVGATRLDITDTDKANEAANPGVVLSDAPSVDVTAPDPRFPGIKAGRYTNYPSPAADYQHAGYLFEMDFADRAQAERTYLVTRGGTPFTSKVPENAQVDEFGFESSYLQGFEDALFAKSGVNAAGRSWQDYIDVPSFARYYALQELIANDDGFKSSTYFYMDKGGKLFAGPLWDADRTMGGLKTAPSPSSIHVGSFTRVKTQWIKQLLSKPEFRAAVTAAYRDQVGPVADEVLSTKLSTCGDEVAESMKLNRLRWGVSGESNAATTPAGDMAILRSYFDTRNASLKSTFNASGYQAASLPDGIYQIANGNLVADIDHASRADGANATLWNNSGDDNQRFRITRGDDGYYTIINVNSGKALEVANSLESDGANVDQSTPNGQRNQKWLIGSTDGTHYSIMSALSIPSIAQSSGGRQVGWVLTAAGNGTGAGTNLEIRTDAGSSGQRFTFTASAAKVNAGRTYTIATALKSTQVLDVAKASSAPGANIQLWSSNGGKNQQFTLQASTGGSFVIRTGTGGVLDADKAGMTIRTNVQQWIATGGENQKWSVVPTGDGKTFYVINKLNGLYLNAAGSGTASGTNIWLYTNNGGNAYKFIFTLK